MKERWIISPLKLSLKDGLFSWFLFSKSYTTDFRLWLLWSTFNLISSLLLVIFSFIYPSLFALISSHLTGLLSQSEIRHHWRRESYFWCLWLLFHSTVSSVGGEEVTSSFLLFLSSLHETERQEYTSVCTEGEERMNFLSLLFSLPIQLLDAAGISGSLCFFSFLR